LSTVSFGRAAGAPVSLQGSDIDVFYRWAVVDQTFGGAWCAHPFVDQLDHFNDALTLRDTSLYSIADFDGVGRFR
jgi:hypothetical protein